MQIIPLLNNLTFLMALCLIALLAFSWLTSQKLWQKSAIGFVFGLASIGVMHNSIEIVPGLFFDMRTIILPLAGIFGGYVIAIIAALLSLVYRVWVGGPGMIFGFIIILSSAAIGALFYYLKDRKIIKSPVKLYLGLAVMVHLLFLASILIIPTQYKDYGFYNVVYPLLIVLPLLLFFICLLFHWQEQNLLDAIELKESQKRFRQLFDNNPAVFLLIDPATQQIADANKAAVEFYGWTYDQLRGKKISDINTLDTGSLKTIIDTVLACRSSKRFEFQHRLANGVIRDVEAFSTPIDLNGKKYLYSMVHDITDRKKGEYQLRQSEMSYRGLFNTVKDAIYIQDTQGIFLDVNEGVEKMYGYPRDMLVGKSPEFLAAPDLNNALDLRNIIDRALEGETVMFEFQGKRSNGEIFPKIVTLYKGMYFNQDVIIAIARDVTEERKTEKIILETQENLNALINVIDQVILLLDKNGCILIYNETFARRYPDETQLTGKNIFELITEDTSYLRKKYLIQVLQTRKPLFFEEEIETKSWYIYYYPVLDNKGRVKRVALYANDITDQKKVLKLQSDLQIAEKAALMKQQFLANMSHEMRTPLNGIIGMTDLLQKTRLDDTQNDWLSTIMESSMSLLALINDVLELSSFESGKVSLKTDSVSTTNLKKRILDLFYNSMAKKNIAFDIVISPEFPERFIADERRLVQVLTNLIGNALKFTVKGYVNVVADVVSKDNETYLLKFVINDSGVGIEEDFISQIFGEFVQCDSTRTREYEGTGLGLPISRRFVELMGGEIRVESKVGNGSSFWFTFSAQFSPHVSDPLPETKDEQAPLEISVLLVEDKLVNTKVATLILKSFGCLVDVAENGLVSIEKVMKNHYDVVLMDIHMPVMDGVTAVKKLRETNQKLPYIIGLSAEAMEGDAEKYIAAGMDDYITKPLVSALLYDKLSKIKKYPENAIT